MSLVRTATNIFSWTDTRSVILICLVLPFLWKLVEGVDGLFRSPMLFTFFSFGIYASMIVATMYVDGTTGGARMADILFYSYYIWLFCNIAYWMGWIQCRRNKLVNKADVFFSAIVEKHALGWCLILGICLLGASIGFKKYTTIYKAYWSLNHGYAQAYGAMWEERLKLLNDESVDVVYVELMDVYPEMIIYADIQKDENLWVNDACATYYGKRKVEVAE